MLLSNLYLVVPDNLQVAVEKAIQFLDGGKLPEEGDEGGSPLRLYSFSKDAGFIFAAFRQTHNIDLESEDLHWWKFMTLFMDLGQDTTFCNLVGLRQRLATGTASKEERAAAHKMGDLVTVPKVDDRTVEEKEQEQRFLDMVAKQKRNK